MSKEKNVKVEEVKVVDVETTPVETTEVEKTEVEIVKEKKGLIAKGKEALQTEKGKKAKKIVKGILAATAVVGVGALIKKVSGASSMAYLPMSDDEGSSEGEETETSDGNDQTTEF